MNEAAGKEGKEGHRKFCVSDLLRTADVVFGETEMNPFLPRLCLLDSSNGNSKSSSGTTDGQSEEE